MTVTQKMWWKDGTVYQIYPASFKDSNGDGLGDIPGITSKLDYLKDLGIEIIWVSPMYDSPQIDMGYDISNYEEVYAPFGSVADMEELIEQCHARGMRIILDLVINHTSDQHAWFKESRSSKDNPKRDWYMWKPARYDDKGNRIPPNNWRSFFSEPAWEWDEQTQEYYLHLFAKEQPDLNWENEETRNAIYDSAMKFWLDKGVDGFRVDTVNMYSKAPGLKDVAIVDSKSFYQPAATGVCNGPRMHEFLREMNTKVLNKYDTMTVGELPFTPDPDHVLRYVSSTDKQINMCFQFDLCDLGLGSDHKFNIQSWTLGHIKQILSKWQTFHENSSGWTTAFIENHDQGRSVSRYCSDATPESRVLSAKMLSIMMTTLTGTLFVYQGQEIGMINAPTSWPAEEYIDIESKNYYNLVAKQTGNDPKALAQAMKGMQILARDHARLPMQWSSAPNAGFTPKDTPENVKTWMRVHDGYKECNVQDQLGQKGSVLEFWKKMLRLRKEYGQLFIHGIFRCQDTTAKNEDENEDKILMYTKTSGDEVAVIALNFSADTRPFTWPETLRKTTTTGREWKLIVCNYEDETDAGIKVDQLRAWEGKVWLLT